MTCWSGPKKLSAKQCEPSEEKYTCLDENIVKAIEDSLFMQLVLVEGQALNKLLNGTFRFKR